MALFIFVIIASIAILIISVLWKRKQLTDSLPPGPPALPLIGNLLQIDRNDARKTFLKWHKQYGPVFTVWLGGLPNVFVTGYDMMQELFVKRGDEFAHRADSFIFELFTSGKYGIVNTNGEMWKEQRRFSLHTLRNFGFGRKLMEEKIEAETSKFINSINRKIQENGNGKGNFDIKPFLDVCISNIVSSVIIGRSYEADDPLFLKLSKALDDNVQVFSSVPVLLLNSFPWLRHVPLLDHFGYDLLMKNINNFLSLLNTELAERKRQFSNETHESDNEPTDFVSAYWAEMKRKEKAGESMGYFDDCQLTAICGDIWAAGISTTVTTLHWGILLIMHHPEVQKKVQQEIDTVVGPERTPNMNDRIQMPFTSAVIHEIQRYANILPVNLPHTVKEDTKVLDYTIPKGVTIVPQIAVLHYDDAVYANPSKFDPNHFLEADGKTLKKTDTLMPFSLGKRQCMGESLARMELFLILTALLQKFSFSFVENEPKPTLKPMVGFTSNPSPYRVCAVPR